MINEPPVDLLIKQLSPDGKEVSRYCLCVVAAKRARQILEQRDFGSSAYGITYNPNPAAAPVSAKPTENVLVLASKEIGAGKIKAIKD
ncbi:MAG: DNA-directed RNA polymerase subunit omega [Clostridia bacterium]|nr:DNA-directed RNA polymerase subunit omega [Clostridia bacterium]